MTPFPLVLTDTGPEAVPFIPEEKPCLIITLVIDPEQHLLFSHHLTRTIDAHAIAKYEGATLKLTIRLFDQT
jgi:hypothetical protein